MFKHFHEDIEQVIRTINLKFCAEHKDCVLKLEHLKDEHKEIDREWNILKLCTEGKEANKAVIQKLLSISGNDRFKKTQSKDKMVIESKAVETTYQFTIDLCID